MYISFVVVQISSLCRAVVLSVNARLLYRFAVSVRVGHSEGQNGQTTSLST